MSIILSVFSAYEEYLAKLQQSCSRLMIWRKADGRMLAYLR
jgi:hypothetical protein